MKCSLIKRIFCAALSVLLLMGMFPMAASAAADTTAPVLKSISLSTTAVTVPAEVTVTMDASDDLSGIEMCRVALYSQELDKTLSLFLESSGELLQGVLMLDEYIPSGVFKIVDIFLQDNAGNFCEYCLEPKPSNPNQILLPQAAQEISLTVNAGATPDTTPPQLKGVTLSASSVTTPGDVTVTVYVTDDLSGADFCHLEFYCKDENASYSVVLVESNGKLQGILHLDQYVPAGTYQIVHAYITDAAGNGHEYYADPAENASVSVLPAGIAEITLEVKSSGPKDTEAPRLTAVTFSSSAVTVPDQITVTFDTTDDVSGANFASLTLYCQETSKELSVSAELTDGKLQGTLTLNAYVPEGTYIVTHAYVSDAAGRGREYSINATNEYGNIAPMPDAVKELKLTVTIPDIPEVTEPEVTDPKPTDPEVTEPKPTEPKPTDPEVTEPKPTEPKPTDPEVTEPKPTEPKPTDPEVTEPKPTEPKPTEPDVTEPKPTEPEVQGVTRIAGGDRYQTSFKSADQLKAVLGVSKFQNIVVASGTDFPDALAGSYLAAVKNAPILLVRAKNVNDVKDYIKKNLVSGGNVYLLGGKNAVPTTMETGLDGFTVKRLGGATRYDTNLLILKEAGVGDKDIIVCTGLNFADSLSASAVGLPILLVKDGLYASQKEFLKTVSGDYIIIGGTVAVNNTVEKQLKGYGDVKRLAGNTRYDTSVMVAKEFFNAPTSAVLAYAQNFPDGLCGGPVAYNLNAPLILTDSNKPTAAVKYTTGLAIKSGYVLGGTGLISDKVVKQVFSMAGNDAITVK